MYKEGNICMAVIEACLEQNIPVLTLHDSFVCNSKDAVFLEQIIKSRFYSLVGVNCQID